MDDSRIQQAKARLGIIGNAPGLLKAIGRALRVAPIDLSVLVTGESGSGKEFFPRIIHAFSPRKHSKYIAVNCGAIPDGTIDSELFGHEKGAFTGAVSSRKGYFEEANGGTIFLDEVGELPLSTQARLLRVLETGEFMKVGSSQVQKTNIRIVAATNVDMAKAIAEGKFREDLFYRLASVQITVPPLRDRGDDILLLSRKFLTDFADTNRTPTVSLTADAREALLNYSWPGNVRQLKNVIEQVALFDAGEEVSAKDLKEFLPEIGTSAIPAVFEGQRLPVAPAQPSDKTYEREREMLFSLIFKMKNEIEKLQETVDALSDRVSDLEGGRRVPEEVTAAETALPANLVKYSPTASKLPGLTHKQMDGRLNGTDDVVDAMAEAVDDAVSEREAIRLALERNLGRRKAAAQELNISERTLYRKIKEYNLE